MLSATLEPVYSTYLACRGPACVASFADAFELSWGLGLFIVVALVLRLRLQLCGRLKQHLRSLAARWHLQPAVCPLC